MVKWMKNRMKERTSWDGAICIGLGLMILFMAPLAKIAAGLAIAWGDLDYLEIRIRKYND